MSSAFTGDIIEGKIAFPTSTLGLPVKQLSMGMPIRVSGIPENRKYWYTIYRAQGKKKRPITRQLSKVHIKQTILHTKNSRKRPKNIHRRTVSWNITKTESYIQTIFWLRIQANIPDINSEGYWQDNWLSPKMWKVHIKWKVNTIYQICVWTLILWEYM